MKHLGLILAATVLVAAPAAAGPYFVTVSGAYNTYDMGTANDYLDSVNEEYGETIIDHLDSGGSFALGLGRIYDNRLAGSIVYEHLFAKVQSNTAAAPLTINAPANVIRFQLAWGVARLGPVIPYLQGGAGIIWNNGYLEYQDENGNNKRHDFSGTTLELVALVGLEVRLSQRYGLNLAGGYRLADISSPSWDASSFGGYGTFDGPGFDYSGPFVRAGLRISLDWGIGDASETRDTSEDTTGWM